MNELKEKDNTNSALFTLLIFLFIFNIPLHLFKIPFSSGKVIAIFGILYLLKDFFLIPKSIKIDLLYFKYIFGVAIILGVVFIVNNLIHSTKDTYYFVIPIFYIVEYLIGSIFLIRFFKVKSIDTIIRGLITISIAQAIVMVFSLFVPPLKDFVFAIMDADPQSHNFSNFGMDDLSFRGFALASDRTLGMSVFFANVGFFISLFLVYSKDAKKKYIVLSVAFFLICLGGLLAARTFFLGLFLNIVLFVLYLLFLPPKAKYLSRYYRNIMIIIITAIILVPIIIANFFPEYFDMFELAYEWAFEMFINLFENGSIETQSSSDLLTNHLSVIPSSASVILIGDSDRTFINGIHYMGQFTDSGYLRMIYVFGIIGSLAFYVFWIYIIYLTYRLNRKLEGIGLLLTMMAVNLFICQIKYDVFPGSSINFKIIVLLFVFGIVNKSNKILSSENVLY